jgi:hypothetical protein
MEYFDWYLIAKHCKGKNIPTGFIVDVGKAGIASLFVILFKETE